MTAPPTPLGERLVLALTPLIPALVFLPGGRWLLPVVAPLSLYRGLIRQVAAGAYLRAWGLAMIWAGLLSLGVIVLVLVAPEAAGNGILNGEAYREEMFHWIATGAGRENEPRAFIPQHLLHVTLFVLLTWASAGYLGLALGAFLLNYMSYFVGSFAVASGRPLLGAVAAWVPWSVLRVMAFVLLGVLFARPLLARRIWPFRGREYRLLGLALLGLSADILVKALLAPTYGRFLRELVRTGLAGVG